MVPEVNEKKRMQGCEVYRGSLCVPTAARCHCFRLPNNSVGAGVWGPRSVPVVPPVPCLAPSGTTTSGLQPACAIQGFTRNSGGRQGTGWAGCVVRVWGGLTHAHRLSLSAISAISACLACLPQEVTGWCCRPQSMHGMLSREPGTTINIAQNYRVEGASPLWVEKGQLATLCPSPQEAAEHYRYKHRAGRLTCCQVVRFAALGAR